MSVGTRLKQLRIERGLTQTDLGKILGMTKGAIQKYECGQIRNFKADTIKTLCEFFHMSPIFFIYDELPPHTNDVKDATLSYFGETYGGLVLSIETLTDEGQRKVIDYCQDLMLIPKYRKEGLNNDWEI